jgi:predicted kinase
MYACALYQRKEIIAMEKAGHRPQELIKLPRRTLLVLCGAAGSGKSTFAQRLVASHQHQGLKVTSIVSSDHCRALVCDDETNQQVNRDSFDLFHYIIYKRMLQGRFTVADSTALQADARHRMLGLARRHNYYTCIFVFDIPLNICILQDQSRLRTVGEQVITYHTNQLPQTLNDIQKEGWHQIHTLTEADLTSIHEHIVIENA